MADSQQTTPRSLERAIQLTRERAPKADRQRLARFVEAYFAGVSEAEIGSASAENLYGAALSHWNLATSRLPGRASVRVYTPNYERHGWSSVHSVVDVVCDNTPFVVDSLKMALYASDLSIHSVTHPTFTVHRDDEGRLCEFESLDNDSNAASPGDVSRSELFIHFEVDRIVDDAQSARIYEVIESVIAAIDAAVADWQPMRERLLEAAQDAANATGAADAEDTEEASALLRWLHEDHFTLLGYYHHRADGTETESARLGILRNFGGEPPEIPGPLTEGATTDVLVITQSDVQSGIHRPGYYDYISARRFDEFGTYVGEHIFIGHFTANVFHSNLADIPWLRLKLRRILQQAPFHAESHSGRALINALETLPRETMFHFGVNELLTTGTELSRAEERRNVSLFIHQERYGRFVSCLTLIPRSRFSTQTRDKVQKILVSRFEAADCEFSVQLTSSRLARVHFVLRVDPGRLAESVDIAKLEVELNEATRSWSDRLQDTIRENFGDDHGPALARKYASAFKQDFQEHYSCNVAAVDIDKIERLSSESPIAISLYRPLELSEPQVRLRLYERGEPASLSTSLETLENMGLTISEARPSRVDPAKSVQVWIHDFSATHSVAGELNIDESADRFVEAFIRITQGGVEDDALNRLVLGAGLSWREVVALRAYSQYLRQTGVPFSRVYMRNTLCGNPEITRALVDLFHCRFDPDHSRDSDENTRIAQIEALLDAVDSLDQDRILRSFLAVIKATLRTNFYQIDEHGEPKAWVSLKLDPASVPDLPAPRPKFEVFVYSPRVEGIHLRGGRIARGGLRWSDRREDFRTEVLGLVKAQTIKNAVIVPHGAKGGFVPKLLETVEDRLAEGIACYRIFIRALLDITDNLHGNNVIPPERVVRHDSDDPYLVVAADKGTATFSDIANGIAGEYGFWLGDAFASGGSVGYDHKAMGITARGAWESVKRHFREKSVDTQTMPFTVVGIGDMAGDVFGNGMLRSNQIRLVAAFNHAHIFIDPEPDAQRGFAERSRLFAMPGSSWTDYDTQCLSEGGAIFARSAKSITLSPQASAALGTQNSVMTPAELISCILRAPVDLLWNGGIGTYIKAEKEAHSAAGDRTNDAVRVDASELRCKVIGEGGNLGITQKGRIEFAANGGAIYTDSIDNSAGVDCSDHEVNIKILLNQIVEDGDLTRKQRDELLADMTNEVADLVLRTNYVQTLAISLAVWQSAEMLEVHSRLIANLESEGRIVRRIDHLPDETELLELRESGKGLTGPEFSVLIGHVKLALFDALLESDLPDLPFFTRELLAYFPGRLRQSFADRMPEHRLRKEIITNVVVNEVVNWGGITFVFRIAQETGATPADVCKAWFAAREIFDQRLFRDQVCSLDNRIAASEQAVLFLESRKLIERGTRWLLRFQPQSADVISMIDRFTPGVRELSSRLADLVDTDTKKRLEKRLRSFASDIPAELREQVTCFEELSVALDVVTVAEQTGKPIECAAAVYYRASSSLGLHRVRGSINELPRTNRWQTLARTAFREDLDFQQRELACRIIEDLPEVTSDSDRVEQWLASNRDNVKRVRSFLQALMLESSIDSAMVASALRELRRLGQAESSVKMADLDELAAKANP